MRPDAKREFYPQLEGIRGVAVFLVIISHFIIVRHFPKLIFLELGFWGVNIFFVLSGFLITESLLVDKSRGIPSGIILKNFFVKRVLRIFPIYYLVVFLLWIFNVDNFNNLIGWSLTYTLNIRDIWFGSIPDVIVHFWSLCVEEQFYLIWPFLILFFPTNRTAIVIICAIILGVMCRFFYTYYGFENFKAFNHGFMFSCLDALCFGALLSYLKINYSDTLSKYLKFKWLPFICYFIFLTFSYFSGKQVLEFQVLGRLLVSITAFFIIGNAAMNLGTPYSFLLKNGVIRYLGKISYGLYVYHLVLYVLFSKLFFDWWRNLTVNRFSLAYYNAWFFAFCFFSIISVIVASLSYQFIETPFLRWKNKFSDK